MGIWLSGITKKRLLLYRAAAFFDHPAGNPLKFEHAENPLIFFLHPAGKRLRINAENFRSEMSGNLAGRAL